MADVPFFPSLVAVIAAEPVATPVTTPLLLTVATAGTLVDHVTVRPLSRLPAESFGVAVNWTVAPTRIVAELGATVTEATGTGATVTAAVPLFPPAVAVMVAEPAVLPVTSPLALTVATAVPLLAHVTVAPLSGLPAESFGVAVTWTVAPTRIVAELGVTITEATGTGATVTAAVPLFPPAVAVMVAEPAVLPVTSPLALTVATAVPLLAHVTVVPLSGLPAESFGVAVSWTVAPTRIVAELGVTVTEATGTVATVTVIADVPLWPSDVAVMVAEPAATPDTTPLAFTLATAPLLLDHDTVRPVSGFPAESRGVAMSCVVPPTERLTEAGLTDTAATGTGITETALESARELPVCLAVTRKLPGAFPAV